MYGWIREEKDRGLDDIVENEVSVGESWLRWWHCIHIELCPDAEIWAGMAQKKGGFGRLRVMRALGSYARGSMCGLFEIRRRS